MRIIYQWIPWSYSHLTYKKNKNFFSKKITKVQWFNTYEDVWANVDEKSIAIMPFENSYIGNIWKNYSQYIEMMDKLDVIWEVMVKAEHCLVSKEKSIEDVKHVYSAPDVLAQCKKFIKKHKLSTHEYLDTAMAAEAISLWIKENGAAIAPKLSAVEYKLNVLAENIQDVDDNITRFLIIAQKWNNIEFTKKQNKVSLHFTLTDWFEDFNHIFRIFDVFKATVVKMNLYPTGEKAFEQSVCMDIKFNDNIDEAKACIDKIAEYCKEMNILWIY